MAGVDYDGIDGFVRVIRAGKTPNTFALDVLTYHAAIEVEIEMHLRQQVRHPDRLFSGNPRFTFAHKAKLLSALWVGNVAQGAAIALVLKEFQDLRDKVAHPSGAGIRSCFARLKAAYLGVFPGHEQELDQLTMKDIAVGICVALDDSEPSRWQAIYEEMSRRLSAVSAEDALGG